MDRNTSNTRTLGATVGVLILVRAAALGRVPERGLGPHGMVGGTVLTGLHLRCGGCNERDGGTFGKGGWGSGRGGYFQAPTFRSLPPYNRQPMTLDPHAGSHQATNVQDAAIPIFCVLQPPANAALPPSSIRESWEGDTIRDSCSRSKFLTSRHRRFGFRHLLR